jgi:hypothetical protein
LTSNGCHSQAQMAHFISVKFNDTLPGCSCDFVAKQIICRPVTSSLRKSISQVYELIIK